jgi:predicted  nucleic acid-binding Zn-ribbon protein
MENKKEITIEVLARMVQRGFDNADKNVNKRFDIIETDIKDIKKRLDSIENRLDIVERKLESLDRRVMFLEDKITEHSKELKEIRISVQKIQKNQEMDGVKVIRLEQRVDNLEMKIGA